MEFTERLNVTVYLVPRFHEEYQKHTVSFPTPSSSNSSCSLLLNLLRKNYCRNPFLSTKLPRELITLPETVHAQVLLAEKSDKEHRNVLHNVFHHEVTAISAIYQKKQRFIAISGVCSATPALLISYRSVSS